MSEIIHSYDEAVSILGKRKSRKLANNTYLEYVTEDVIAIRLHDTHIIKYERLPNELNSEQWIKPIVLNTGGWRTVTTKERMNRFSPARIGSEKGIWYVYASSDKFVYHDGIKIGHDGHPIDELPDTGTDAMLKRKLDRLVRNYIDGYCAHLVAEAAANGKIPFPNNGDCWYCLLFQPREMGFDHYLSHFEERYFVPSLLWRALQNRGNPSFCWQMIELDAKRGDTRMARETLRSFFKRIKPNLLEEYKRASVPEQSR